MVPKLPRIVAVSADTGRALPPLSPVHDHVLALAADGTVWAWGENRDGECGNGTPGVTVNDPVKVSDPVTFRVQVLTGPGHPLRGVVAIATGGAHSLALRADGTVWAWGYNGTGQLGNGAYREGANPYAAPVPGLRSIRSIAAGPAMSFAVDWDGRAWAWGFPDNANLCLELVPETERRFVVNPTQIINADGTPFNFNVRGPSPLLQLFNPSN